MGAGYDFFHPLRQADFEYLLEGRPFLVLRGQLIFRSRGEVVITNIRPGQRFTADAREGEALQLCHTHAGGKIRADWMRDFEVELEQLFEA